MKPSMNLGDDNLWDHFKSKGVKEENILLEIYKYYYNCAINDYPNDGICGFCGGENKFVDDCGFFYCISLTGDKKMLPTCEKCHHGEPGTNHIKIYGLGER